MDGPPVRPEAACCLAGNGLLDALPQAEWVRLEPLMERVDFATKQVIFEPRQAIDQVYFPLTGAISMLTVTPDRAVVTVASVGREGMAGLPVFLGAPSTANLRAVAQMPGSAICMPAGVFHARAQAPGAFHDVMAGYANAFLTQATQEVACNRRHSVMERCSRWLLITQDRTGAREFPMTQEFLAELLGTRRASVVGVAGALQKALAIQCRRGRIRIVNREVLETFACECYLVIRAAFSPHDPAPYITAL